MRPDRLLCLLLCVVLLTACQHDEVKPEPELVPLHIVLDEVQPEVSVITRALPNALPKPTSQADFHVSVIGTNAVEQNEGNASITSILVPADTYTLRAWFGNNPALALNTPYYEGTTTVEVRTPYNYVYPVEASITCGVANALVSVQYLHHDGATPSTECFDEQFLPGYYVEATLSGAEPVRLTDVGADFATTDHVYFRAGTSPTFTFHGTRRSDGATGTITLATPVVEAGHHLVLRLSISTSGDIILISDDEKADNTECLVRPFINRLND